MTNSHNRTLQQQQGGRHSDRNSPQNQQNHHQHQQPNNHQSTPQYNSNNHNGQRKSHHQNGRPQQKSPSSATYFNSNGVANGPVGSVSPFKYLAQAKNGNGYIVGRQTPPSATASSSPSILIANGSSRMSPGGHSSSSTPLCFASPAGVSSSPPNLHFASSKCFDAPSPDSLPRPPQHWTSQRANGAASVPIAAAKSSPFSPNGFAMGATPRIVEASDSQKSSGSKSSSSKRRLFNNDTAIKASQKSGGRGNSANIIKAGGCMPISSTTASDIFSHNLKLMLNVQA